jgi:hypothetical protein
MNSTQNKRFYAMLSKAGLRDQKAELVLQVSDGRTEHSSELSDREADALIDFLAKRLNQASSTPDYKVFTKEDEKANLKRRRIISKLMEMGAVLPNGKADMPFIYSFIEKRWKKPFNSLTNHELRKIAAILEDKFLPWYYSKLEEPGFKGIKGYHEDYTEA